MSSDEPHSRIHNVSNISFSYLSNLSIPLISEGIIPGAYELTVIFHGPSSAARTRVKDATADFDAA